MISNEDLLPRDDGFHTAEPTRETHLISTAHCLTDDERTLRPKSLQYLHHCFEFACFQFACFELACFVEYAATYRSAANGVANTPR
jgi:hypothetical protein